MIVDAVVIATIGVGIFFGATRVDHRNASIMMAFISGVCIMGSLVLLIIDQVCK